MQPGSLTIHPVVDGTVLTISGPTGVIKLIPADAVNEAQVHHILVNDVPVSQSSTSFQLNIDINLPSLLHSHIDIIRPKKVIRPIIPRRPRPPVTVIQPPTHHAPHDDRPNVHHGPDNNHAAPRLEKQPKPILKSPPRTPERSAPAPDHGGRESHR